ncbi:transcriptional regulator LysR family [Clostridium sp. CAG:169]|nr:transcriptional regulator LysR family [Clostridium sp. CAG:169]
MDIRQLLYFTTIAEEGSISAAAKKLHLSQPPLSYQMKLLEEELHLPLIERSARGIALTEAGRVLYKRAQGILELSELTRKEMLAMASGFTGTLHIGTVSSSGASLLGWRIPAFYQKYPQIGFAIHEGNTFELMEMLESGLIELAIVRTPFHNDQLNCLYLSPEPMIAAGAASFFPAGMPSGQPISLELLGHAPVILYRRFEKILLSLCEQKGITPQVFCIADDARTTLMWAEAGLGVAVVPQSAYRIMPHHNMVYGELSEEDLHTRIAAVCKKGCSLSWAAQQFLEIFAQQPPSAQTGI